MLNVLRPTAINADAQIVSTNITDSADPTWSGATTYALGDTVKYQHVRYESLQAANINNTPGGVNNTWWLELGPTNQWAMFDNQTSTVSTQTGSIVVRIKPGQAFNSVAVLGVYGAATITCDIYAGAGGSPVMTQTKDLDNTFISGWYQWLFEPYDVYTDLLFGALDTSAPSHNWGAYLAGEVRVTITGTTGGTTVGCAGLLVGTTVELGAVQWGAGASIQDYSVKETDAFGTTTLVQRAWSKQANYQLMIPNAQLRRVYSTLAQLRATPCVWVASSEYWLSPLTVFGFYKDFSVNVAYPDYSTASLEVEGLT